jgi:rubredoxin
MPTYLPRDINEACICGRLNTRVHCPKCGVYSVYARSRRLDDIVSTQGAEQVALQTYKCRRCGHIFNDAQWRENCAAPFFGSTSGADQEAKRDSITAQTSPVLLEALERLNGYVRLFIATLERGAQ